MIYPKWKWRRVCVPWKNAFNEIISGLGPDWKLKIMRRVKRGPKPSERTSTLWRVISRVSR